jgi:hypothetical protein
MEFPAGGLRPIRLGMELLRLSAEGARPGADRSRRPNVVVLEPVAVVLEGKDLDGWRAAKA